MWASMLLLAATAALPNQSAGLQIGNIRVTTGPFGSVRKDQVPELQYGDIFFAYYDVDNLVVNELGEAEYTITMEISNSKGSVIFTDGPRDGKAVLSLGGNKMPAMTHSSIGKEQEPGEYTIKVTITDRGNKNKNNSAEMTRKFKVKKAEFGIVQPGLKFVGQNDILNAPPMAMVGQTLVASCFVGNFGRDKNDDPDLEITITVTDDAGKATTSKPSTQKINKNIPKAQDFINIMYPVDCNRAGKYTIEIAANDKLNKKSDKVTFPITVQELK
jgi:hypothetical protein